VAHAFGFRRAQHLEGFGVIHRDGLFGEHVFSGVDRGEGDGRVSDVGRGDDDRLHVVARDNLFVFRRSYFDAGLLCGALQSGGIGVAERDHFCIRAERKTRKMILEGNTSAADNRNADARHPRNGKQNAPTARAIL
jgi:hypothetical protein